MGTPQSRLLWQQTGLSKHLPGDPDGDASCDICSSWFPVVGEFI